MKIAAALIAAGLACIGYRALAAERGWEIVLTERPTLAEPDRRRTFVISEAYETRERCMQILAGVRIKAPGAKARCLPKED